MRARAEAQLLLVGRLNDAAKAGSVTAALAILRQLDPEAWGERRKVRVEGAFGEGSSAGTGPPLIIELYASDRDSKELAEIEAELAKDTTR